MPFLSGREEEMRREKSRLEQKASVNRGPNRAKASRHKRKAAVREGKKGKGRKIKAGARREGGKIEATAQKKEKRARPHEKKERAKRGESAFARCVFCPFFCGFR